MKNLCNDCFTKEFCGFAYGKTCETSCESYRPGGVEVTPANVLAVRAEFDAKLREVDQILARCNALAIDVDALIIFEPPTFRGFIRWILRGFK